MKRFFAGVIHFLFYKHRLLGIYLVLWFLCSTINLVGSLVDYPHGIRAIEAREPETVIPLGTGDDGKPREMQVYFYRAPIITTLFPFFSWQDMVILKDIKGIVHVYCMGNIYSPKNLKIRLHMYKSFVEDTWEDEGEMLTDDEITELLKDDMKEYGFREIYKMTR